jgi:cyanophycin synthetase
MRAPAIHTVKQRFLRGPSLWSGTSCLVTVVDMGAMAHGLTSDHPGLADRVLSLFPGLEDFAQPMRRGAYLAELLGRMALELQGLGGAPCKSRCALTVHGKGGEVKIITAARTEALAIHAFELARTILADLCHGKKAALWRRPAPPAPLRVPSGQVPLELLYQRARERRSPASVSAGL